MKRLFTLVALVAASAISVSAQQQSSAQGGPKTMTASATANVTSAAPKVGEAAPDFKLPYATKEEIFFRPDEHMTLASLKGKNVILAFKANDKKDYDTLRAELEKLAGATPAAK